MSTKMKNCRTFYETQTASRPSGNHSAPPNQIKSYYVSGTKIFLQRCTEIYRNIQKYTAFKVLQECSSWAFKKWCSANVFLTPSRKMLAGKSVKWERSLAALREYIIFSVKWVKVLKMRFFERNCIVKRVIFSASFCWLWGFLLENQKNKKTLKMSIKTCGQI